MGLLNWVSNKTPEKKVEFIEEHGTFYLSFLFLYYIADYQCSGSFSWTVKGLNNTYTYTRYPPISLPFRLPHNIERNSTLQGLFLLISYTTLSKLSNLNYFVHLEIWEENVLVTKISDTEFKGGNILEKTFIFPLKKKANILHTIIHLKAAKET